MQTHLQSYGHIQGLRKITPGLRTAEDHARRWVGLPKGASKASLLRLLEDVPAQRMGIGKRERDFLHRLVKMQPAECFKTADALQGCDLEAAGLALVSTYSDVFLTAELDVTSRTLARWRAQATEKGWISFRDSADRTRFRVGPADAPTEAYGIDLRPLVARYAELERLRDAAKTTRSEFTRAQRTLSERRNRLRSLQALVVADGPMPFVETALKAIEAVRRGKDLDHARLALAEVESAIAQLEGYLDTARNGFFGVTPTSGAHDKNATQLPPTTPTIEFNSESSLGREGHRTAALAAGASFDAETVPPPAPAAEADQDEPEDEIVWQASDYDDEDEAVVVWESPASAGPAYRRSKARVNLPSLGQVLAGLPAILALKHFPFARHPSFPTDRSLVVAYGQAAASRLRLTQEEIRAHCARDNDLAFAVAALLAEFSDDVHNRRAYLLGIVGRINDPVIPVDLWASWQRLERFAVGRAGAR